MLGAVVAVIGLAAFVAWLSTIIHALLLVPHRRDDVSLLSLWFQGYRFYLSDTWKESGQAIHRRFRMSALAFFLCIALGLLSGFLLAR